MSSERDSTQAFLAWLREPARVNAERVAARVLGEIEFIPQRRSFRPAWRTLLMNKVVITASAAGLLLVAVLGSGLLPRLGILGPGGAPPPGPTLLARGTFVAGFTVDVEAFGRDADVTGHLTVTEGASGPTFSVDLQCARTTADGYILIGGVTTSSNTGVAPEGTYAAIVLKRGSPVRAAIWSQRGGPSSEAASCLAYLDERFEETSAGTFVIGGEPDPIVGAVELGP